MDKTNRWRMVAWDLLRVQGRWTIGYIIAFFLINIALHLFLGHLVGDTFNFLTLSLQSARVFMLIIGLITATHGTKIFVKIGVTRREYFCGNILSTFLLGLTIILSAVMIHMGLGTLLPGYDMARFLTMAVLLEGLLQVIHFYLVGWLIAMGFQRFSKFGGIAVIVFNIWFMGQYQYFWTTEGVLENITFGYSFTSSNTSITFSLAVIFSLVFSFIILGLIHFISNKLEVQP